ncbi:MAG: hypothetical protein ACJ70M_03775, partial [Nitrososphaera sp.]
SYAQQGGDQGGTQSGTQGGQQGGRIVEQGTVTSSPVPLPGLEEQQRATILPLRQDGSIYTGVLTFTATEPVDVVILNMQTLNETERAILNATEDGDLGTLTTAPLNNDTSLVISSITPSYGDSGSPSASIPFAGNALWLHTPGGEPFAASYAVSAQVLQAQTMNNINNVTTATAAGDEGDDGGDGGGAADEDGGDGGGAAGATATAAGDEGDDGGDGGGAANATDTAAGDTDGA